MDDRTTQRVRIGRKAVRPTRNADSWNLVFFQAEDGIRDYKVTGVQTCALPIFAPRRLSASADFGCDCNSALSLRSAVRKSPRSNASIPSRSREPAAAAHRPDARKMQDRKSVV